MMNPKLLVAIGLSFASLGATSQDIQIPYSPSGNPLYQNCPNGQSSCYGDWSHAIQGSTTAPPATNEGSPNPIVSAPTNGNQGGPTFGYWAGKFQGTDAGATSTFSFSNLGTLGNDASVNTLMNTFYGTYGTLVATVTFTNSDNESESYSLIGGETIRDYYNNIGSNFSNTLGPNVQTNNTGTLAPGSVSTVNWWSNYDETNDPNGDGVRLDEQTFLLPTDWAGTTLTGMTIADNPAAGNNTQVAFSAIQLDNNNIVQSATPEPSSLALLGTGILGAAGVLRRRMRLS